MGSMESSDSVPQREANVSGKQADFESVLKKHYGKTQDGEKPKKDKVLPNPEGDNEKAEVKQGFIPFAMVESQLNSQIQSKISEVETKIQVQEQVKVDLWALDSVEAIPKQAPEELKGDLPQAILEQLNQLEYRASELNLEQSPEIEAPFVMADAELREISEIPKHTSPQVGKEAGMLVQLQQPKVPSLTGEDALIGKSLDFETELFAEVSEVVRSSPTVTREGILQQGLPEEAHFSMAEALLTASQPEEKADLGLISSPDELLISPMEHGESMLDNSLHTVANVLTQEEDVLEPGVKIASKVQQEESETSLEDSSVLQEKPNLADDKIAGATNTRADDTVKHEEDSMSVKTPQTRSRIFTDKHTELAVVEIPKQEPVLEVSNQEIPTREVLDLDDKENLFPKLVQNIKSLVTEERSEVRIQLKPDHLGELKIKLSLERGIMVAEFTVQNETVREVIASQLPQLHTALQEQGTQMADVQINIGLGHKEQEQQDQPKSRQFHQNKHGRMAKSATPSASRSYLGGGIWSQVDVRV